MKEPGFYLGSPIPETMLTTIPYMMLCVVLSTLQTVSHEPSVFTCPSNMSRLTVTAALPDLSKQNHLPECH